MNDDNNVINISKKSKIGIFGGSFNPVHNGHISLCMQCCEALMLEKVLLIPANIPPHKSYDELCSNHDRYEMLKLAVQDYPMLEVSDIEYRMSGTSYTYRTIIELKKEYINTDFYFIAGADMLEMFNKWYRYNDLLNEFTLVIGSRESDTNCYEKLLSLKRDMYENTDKIQIVNVKAIELSSTQIRNMIGQGKTVDTLVDEAVKAYIYHHGLYKS